LAYHYNYDYDLGSITAIASTSTFTGCEFRNNDQSAFLDIIIRVYSYHIIFLLSIYDTKFISNEVDYILQAVDSVINIENSTFKYNRGSAMHLSYCKVNIVNSAFNNNQACTLILWSTIIHIHGSEFIGKYAKRGAILSEGETLIRFSEICTFADNRAEQGGAIYLDDESTRVQWFVAHEATVIIANNTASYGGGIYLHYDTNLTLYSQGTLQILNNRAIKDGGGIYVSEYSSINLCFKSLNYISQISNSTNIHFYRNQATNGGGLHLGLSSVIYVLPCLNNIINFEENSADYGGAVFISTDTKFSGQYYYFDLECFFQSETLRNPAVMKCNKHIKPFHFLLNRANYSGSSLYKKIFNNCSMGGRSFEEFKFLSILSNIQNSDIGSSQVLVCFCEDENPDCTKGIAFIDIKTGERLIIDVTVADRENHIVSSSVESEIRGSASVRDDQKIQDVRNGCTDLVFNIYSFEASQQLVMSPRLKNDSIHISTAGSERTIKLNFPACISCPIGFQQIKDDAKGCDCVCDEMRLESLIMNCNYTRETITKKRTTAWITYLGVKNTTGYLMYPYCPCNGLLFSTRCNC
jgi:predicted outer membrane repeat protein